MKVKIHGKSGSDTEASSHESEAEVSDTEVSSTHTVIPSSDSLSLTASTSTAELPPVTEKTTPTSSPAAPVITTTVAASPTWSTASATSTGPQFALLPWQTTTGLDFGRPSSALYVSSPTATPTSAIFETLTKFMKDEFSKLHARIDRAISHRSAFTSISSGTSRFNIQWMERIDEKLEDLQIVIQTNTD
ncbi:location of vulva defective 1-like [Microplitis demolitor]|uniref:location of vulva defective 1-like n=1 Tax=Microplitis demolitor TaxID=69319 RepID=UPI00235B6761|nr:location of vulva defective 1-like [Microplitis demolitor]